MNGARQGFTLVDDDESTEGKSHLPTPECEANITQPGYLDLSQSQMINHQHLRKRISRICFASLVRIHRFQMKILSQTPHCRKNQRRLPHFPRWTQMSFAGWKMRFIQDVGHLRDELAHAHYVQTLAMTRFNMNWEDSPTGAGLDKEHSLPRPLRK